MAGHEPRARRAPRRRRLYRALPIFVRVSEAGPTATAFWRVAIAVPVSVSLLFQPVMAALFAWALLSESLVPLQVFGGLIVLLGIYLARRGSSAGQ
jgi:hypothetical protein